MAFFRIGYKSLKSVPPAVLVAGPVGSGKTTLIVSVARKLGIHAYKVIYCQLNELNNLFLDLL